MEIMAIMMTMMSMMIMMMIMVELSWDPLVADNVNSSSVPRIAQHNTWLLLLSR